MPFVVAALIYVEVSRRSVLEVVVWGFSDTAYISGDLQALVPPIQRMRAKILLAISLALSVCLA